MFRDYFQTSEYRKISKEDSVDTTSNHLLRRQARHDVFFHTGIYDYTDIITHIVLTDVLDAPIIWEEKTYMSNIDGDVKDPYSMLNPDVEAAWTAVRYEHVTAITAQEMERLPGHRETAKLYGGQEGHAVLLEVFHQIHCLDSIRRSYFANSTDTVRGFGKPVDHVDHCFSYLLQMLLCHADVGVMTTRWNEKQQDFAANFNVTRQCRNFDVIKGWAEDRRALFDTPGQLLNLHNS